MPSRVPCLLVFAALAGLAAGSSLAAEPNLVEVEAFSVPIYGEWCGPGYPGEGQNPTPIDAVDRACMVHDKCYGSKGYFDCQCNKDLTTALSKIRCSGSCETNRKLILGTFKALPCKCRNGSCKVGPFAIPVKDFVCMPNLCHPASPRFASKKPNSRSKPSKPKSSGSSSAGSQVDAKTKEQIKSAVDRELSAKVLKEAKDSACAGTAFKSKQGKSSLFTFQHAATTPKAIAAAQAFEQKMKTVMGQMSSCPVPPKAPPPGQRGGASKSSSSKATSKGKKKRLL